MKLEAEHLMKIMVLLKRDRAELFLPFLNETCDKFEINTARRQAAFLAQIAHESWGLHYTKEIASGIAYEGRKDLGNIEPGDGKKFKGRGLIQITGRFNYENCGEALGLDLIEHPELLAEPREACLSAGWFWKSHDLNRLADDQDFLGITKRINGGTTGYAKRLVYFKIANEVLKAGAYE